MTIEDKKQTIITSVKATQDELLVNEIYSLLNNDSETDVADVNELPDELQLKLLKAMEDYNQGMYITHDEFKRKVNTWLTT